MGECVLVWARDLEHVLILELISYTACNAINNY